MNANREEIPMENWFGNFVIHYQLIERVDGSCDNVPDARELLRTWFREYRCDADVSTIDVLEEDNVAMGSAIVDPFVDEHLREIMLNDFNNRPDQLVSINDQVIRVKINVARPKDRLGDQPRLAR
jgi:hypothetical protein